MSDTKTFHPNFDAYKKWLKVRLSTVSIAVILFIVIYGRSNLLLVLSLGFAGAALAYLITMLFLKSKRKRIEITGTTLVSYGAFFGKKTFEVISPKQGILTHYTEVGVSMVSLYNMLLLKSATSHRRLRLLDIFWTYEDLKTIAHSLGLEVTADDNTALQIEAKYPGMMKFSERRPKTTIAVLSITITILILFGIFIVSIMMHPYSSYF